MAAGFMTHVTCRLTAKNRDQLLNPRSVIEYPMGYLYFLAQSHGGIEVENVQLCRRSYPRAFILVGSSRFPLRAGTATKNFAHTPA